MYQLVIPVFDPTVRKLCVHPYEGHPHGCPNFGSADRCPPKVQLYSDVWKLDGPFYAIWSIFDLGVHVRRMRLRHPKWSERQLRNVLYWQGRARAKLRMQVLLAREQLAREAPEVEEHLLVEMTPEALGVNVTDTMKSVGVYLPWPPVDLVYHVALAGIVKE